ncbi:hypothetical protein Ciccas_012810, partial [Cichlidogyrus casuarinus]
RVTNFVFIYQKDVKIKGNSLGELGSELTLTCEAKFPNLDRAPAEESLLWIAPEPVESGPYRSPKMRPFSRKTISRWIDNTTVHNVLTIAQLEVGHSGNWTCRKFYTPVLADGSRGQLQTEDAHFFVSVLSELFK